MLIYSFSLITFNIIILNICSTLVSYYILFLISIIICNFYIIILKCNIVKGILELFFYYKIRFKLVTMGLAEKVAIDELNKKKKSEGESGNDKKDDESKDKKDGNNKSNFFPLWLVINRDKTKKLSLYYKNSLNKKKIFIIFNSSFFRYYIT